MVQYWALDQVFRMMYLPKHTVLGEPAIDLKQRKLQLASMSKLPEMRKQVKRLLKRVEELEQGSRSSSEESSSKAA